MKSQKILWCSNQQLERYNEDGWFAVQVIAESKNTYTSGVAEYLCLLEHDDRLEKLL